MAAPEPMIEIRGVHKSFRRGRLSERIPLVRKAAPAEVLNGVDLDVHQGELVALLG